MKEKLQEKMLALIRKQCNQKKYCIESTEFFAKELQIPRKKVVEELQSLESKKLIEIGVFYDKNGFKRRKITPKEI